MFMFDIALGGCFKGIATDFVQLILDPEARSWDVSAVCASLQSASDLSASARSSAYP